MSKVKLQNYFDLIKYFNINNFAFQEENSMFKSEINSRMDWQNKGNYSL